MKKVLLLAFCWLAFGTYVQAECLQISGVKNSGPNFRIFLTTLKKLVHESDCRWWDEQRDISFEFHHKQCEFEVSVTHYPANSCSAVGDNYCDSCFAECDDRAVETCYSLGTFRLIPRPEDARKLAHEVADKLKSGKWNHVTCQNGED